MADQGKVVLSYEQAAGDTEENVQEVAVALNQFFEDYPHLRAQVTIEASAQVLLDSVKEV